MGCAVDVPKLASVKIGLDPVITERLAHKR